MTDVLSNLLLGFQVALSPSVLMYAAIGCIMGTIVGVLPGLGPLAGMSLLLPISFGLEPTTAIVLLAGIYYGAMYGGSTTSILMRIPGEAASVITCVDGYEMTKKGRAGAALAIAGIGSFIAGTFGVIALMLLAPTLAGYAIKFGPPEYTALMCIGLMCLSYMSSGPMVKTLAMAVLGLLLGMIGIDTMSGYTRFTFGIAEFGDGLGLVPISVGLFGISEVLMTMGDSRDKPLANPKFRELMPSGPEFRRSVGPIARGSVLGFFIGIVPGSAHIISSFASYALERKLSKHPEEFGKGAIEGVAGPESANNAAATGAFVTMLALGVPLGAVQALMLSTLMVHGISPGPMLFEQQPKIVWGFIASMYVGNVILLILNLPMVGLFVNLLRVPYTYLYPLILVFCVIGVYTVNQSVTDIWIMTGAGVVGYVLRKSGFDVAPAMLGFILAPMLETAFRQTLEMSGGDYTFFVQRPVALALFIVAGALLLMSIAPSVLNPRKRAGLGKMSD